MCPTPPPGGMDCYPSIALLNFSPSAFPSPDGGRSGFGVFLPFGWPTRQSPDALRAVCSRPHSHGPCMGGRLARACPPSHQLHRPWWGWRGSGTPWAWGTADDPGQTPSHGPHMHHTVDDRHSRGVAFPFAAVGGRPGGWAPPGPGGGQALRRSFAFLTPILPTSGR